MAELTGFGSVFPGGTSNVYNMTSPPSPIKPGTRARGTDGSEFVFCDFTGTVYGRQPVVISSAFTAQALTISDVRGPIGVACTTATSDQGGWVQVYGRCLMQVGINVASPSDAANGPTTAGTSDAIIFIVPTSATSPQVLGYTTGNVSTGTAHQVYGMTVASDASPGDVSATTSATSHIGSEIAVFLNYPHVVHINYGA